MKADLEQLEKMQEDLFRQQCDLDIQKAMVKHFIKKKEDEILTLTDVNHQSELLTGFVRFERLQDYKYKLLSLSEKIEKYLASL